VPFTPQPRRNHPPRRRRPRSRAGHDHQFQPCPPVSASTPTEAAPSAVPCVVLLHAGHDQPIGGGQRAGGEDGHGGSQIRSALPCPCPCTPSPTSREPPPPSSACRRPPPTSAAQPPRREPHRNDGDRLVTRHIVLGPEQRKVTRLLLPFDATPASVPTPSYSAPTPSASGLATVCPVPVSPKGGAA
jgi:hypothetical protein